MKYVLVLALGILTGLSFSHLPPLQPFRDLPETAKDWKPKMTGNWSEEERANIDRYFNGGVATTEIERFKERQRSLIQGVQAWDANGVEIPDAQVKWEKGEL